MINNYFKKLTLALIIGLTIGSNVFAIVPQKCPPISMVKSSYSLLNYAFPFAGHYGVVSTRPLYFDDWNWLLAVVPVIVDKPEDAIPKARSLIQTVYMGTEVPEPKEDFYACSYSAEGTFVYASTAGLGSINFSQLAKLNR